MSEKILLDENDNVLLDTNNTAFSANFSEGTSGVSSIGGVDGDILLGSGLTINDHTLSATGGGSSYTAGEGIDITSDVISIDDTVVAKKTDFKTINSQSIIGEGDIVRAFKRVVDVLRQFTIIDNVPEALVFIAREAIDKIQREPVNID